MRRQYRFRPMGCRVSGFSYIEVLVATVLIALSLGPALEALSSGIQSSAVQTTSTEQAYLLQAKLEEVLADSFQNIETAATAAAGPGNASSYSDVATLADGRQITRNVYLAGYDADNADTDNDPFTGADLNLLWVRVAIPNTLVEMQTLTRR